MIRILLVALALLGASVSLLGMTQQGEEVHYFEVRRLAYAHRENASFFPSNLNYVVYYAGDAYGSQILKEISAAEPLIRKIGAQHVTVFFTTGANTRVYQKWKLLGYPAELELEQLSNGTKTQERKSRCYAHSRP